MAIQMIFSRGVQNAAAQDTVDALLTLWPNCAILSTSTHIQRPWSVAAAAMSKNKDLRNAVI
jgi:hypothetical protein